jgi:nucleoside-diphosphate-sugar epimerase
MEVLLTGPFGNLGTSALQELVRQGHALRCLARRSRRNEKAAARFAGKIEVVWGDIRAERDVRAAVEGCAAVVHLAAIIPPASEARPDLARETNVDGTRNLLAAMAALPRPPKLIFASTSVLYGLTQDRPPPRTLADPIRPTDHYTRYKAQCERLVRASGLDWAIFRIAASLPLVLDKIDPVMFEIALDTRIEFVHTYDVGLAVANALRVDAVWGRTLHIGGGPRCQIYQRDLVRGALEAVGIGMLPEAAFGPAPFYTDWLDTAESERLLGYQRHTYEDFTREMAACMGYKRQVVRLLRPLIRRLLLRQSPYYRIGRREAGPGPAANRVA